MEPLSTKEVTKGVLNRYGDERIKLIGEAISSAKEMLIELVHENANSSEGTELIIVLDAVNTAQMQFEAL